MNLPSVVRHFKGDYYVVIGECEKEGIKYLLYSRLGEPKVYTRDITEFFALVNHNGKLICRFEVIDDLIEDLLSK